MPNKPINVEQWRQTFVEMTGKSREEGKDSVMMMTRDTLETLLDEIERLQNESNSKTKDV